MIRKSAAVSLTALAVVAGAAAGMPTAAAAPSGPIPQFWESGNGSDLAGLLLKENQVAPLVGVPSVKVLNKSAKFYDDSSVIDNAECLGAWAPAQAKSYDGSGATDVRSEVMGHNKLVILRDRLVVESVVGFPTADQASKYLDHAADSWKGCANRQVTTTPDASDTPQQWQFGQPAVENNGTVITLKRTSTGEGLGACERAMGGRYNVAIDVMVCGGDPTGQAAKIVPEIGKSIPKAG
ncbi:sensor domain-containing protein [Mycobacterium branderi]|uniref:Sensor domain-containing protein n=1 Tax=Mycobacterium branderi TaxID=43348 RepID=A0A7I7WGV9_9MYCO|nr:sensor domain-containing protein [Mycobacterium branderi]MCV7236285.1 sensor domain-containing protein [Mycobacterium branderi]ORA35459.1 hypothetical protein BST20_17870 [Mycobacterium branderi]BBZ15168.1 sensor domain-containing protein [Mycobacterium branderi]